MKKIDISIIIVSYNTKDLTIACLDSVRQYSQDISYEVIIVDNNSTDGSVESLEKYSQKHPQFKLIKSKENLGFGKGNNLGVKNAKGEYMLLLNSDTLFTQNVLKHYLDKYQDKKSTIPGIYSCKLLNKDGSIQASGGYFPDLTNLIAWQLFLDDIPLINKLFKSFHPTPTSYSSQKQPDWVTGAFMILPKSIYEKVKGFDENIFMYTEETELAYRLSKINQKVVYDPTTSIVHLGGASSGSFFALTSEAKYIVYFWQKHYPSWQLPLVKIAIFMGSLLRLLIFGIIKNDEKRRKAYISILRELV